MREAFFVKCVIRFGVNSCQLLILAAEFLVLAAALLTLGGWTFSSGHFCLRKKPEMYATEALQGGDASRKDARGAREEELGAVCARRQ